MRGATQFARLQCWRVVFQSTLLMRGATTLADMLDSIGYISIHAPHARSDSFLCFDPLATYKFQSTLLMRGATIRRTPFAKAFIYFNPRSSCEERRINAVSNSLVPDFNPRSSCEERLRLLHRYVSIRYFNPRSSCEERLKSREWEIVEPEISIHAPHARSDVNETSYRRGNQNFNPRSSCEERRMS